MSRTQKTAKNTVIGLLCTAVSYLLSFVLQAVFIRLLGLEYSGINSVFNDILKILNLADLGFSNAILFKLYKTVAKGDDEATEMYLTAYRKICYLVGAFVGIVGLGFIPFLSFFVKEAPSFSEPLWSLYLLILANSVLTHFINYRSVLIVAKQDRYLTVLIQYFALFTKHILQILALLIYKNIYLYLAIGIFATLLEGLLYGFFSRKRYHLSWHSKKKLPTEEKKDLTKDIGALSVFKFSRTLNSTMDTFFISKFISVAETGIYGSTTVITAGLRNFIDTLNDGMMAGIGDLNASGDKNGLEKVLLESTHLMYLVNGIATAVLVPFMDRFMNWWIGFSLPQLSLIVLIFNFYTSGMNTNVSTFRNSMGLYRKGWKRPLATVIVNFVCSCFLILKMGIVGAFIGTAIANITTVLWYDPFVIYKYGLQKSVKNYMLRWMMYLLFVIGVSGVNFLIGCILPAATTFFALLWQGILYTVVASVLLLALGSLFDSQKRLLRRLAGILKIKNRKRSKADR